MKVLVTGAAGYVGSVCAQALIERGAEVVALDNLVEGHRQAVPQLASFVACDLAERRCLDQAFSAHRVDAVMHFAAEALVEKSVREPSTFYAANVACGVNLLDAMIRHGVRDLIFSSTAAVYGEPEAVPITEDHPKRPINPYGRTKLIFEQILEDYGRHSGLRYVVLRYFNAAGASPVHGEDHREESHLIPRLLQVALGQREHFSVNGTDYPTPDGTCVRDYVHVLDIAEAHLLALEQIEQASGQAFNVGNNRGYSVREVLAAARLITRRAIPSIETPRRPGDPAALVASSEKLRRALGWLPRHSDLTEILDSAWCWKQKFPNGYSGAREASASIA
ncbi:MAG: UDP-glucose 4-epimerase GalE [Acidobacteria bacterium]|nr:UDP-glucose 4-epimerase GalE [Acidobacteriota bacterium]